MIYKLTDTQNGYYMADADNDDFRKLVCRYKKVKCIICSKETSEMFQPTESGKNIITINNTIPSGIIYINQKI